MATVRRRGGWGIVIVGGPGVGCYWGVGRSSIEGDSGCGSRVSLLGHSLKIVLLLLLLEVQRRHGSRCLPWEGRSRGQG